MKRGQVGLAETGLERLQNGAQIIDNQVPDLQVLKGSLPSSSGAQ